MITDWIDLPWSMLNFVLECAYVALPLTAIVLTVDLLAGHFIAARYRFLLWMLVALRMVLPVTVESSFSVQNLWASEASENVTSIAQATAPKAANTTLPSFLDASTESQPRPTGFGAERSAAPLPVWASGWSAAIMRIVPLLWLVGAFVLIARPLLAATRFTWSLRRCEEITDQRVVDVLLRVGDQSGARRRPKLRIVPGLQTPAVFGLLRPTICLPPNALDELSPDQLKMVLHHEVAHVIRRDAMAAWLATIVRAVHWINPVAWLVHWKIMQLMEHSCDEAVLRHNPGQSARSYGELLMQFAAEITPARHRPAVGLSIARPTRRLGNRMKLLMQARQRNTWARHIVAVTLLLAATATGFTDAKTIVAQPRDRQQQIIPISLGGYARLPGTIDLEPHETRTYDVNAAIVQFNDAWGKTVAKEAVKGALSRFLPVSFDGACDSQHRVAGQLQDGTLTITAPAWIHDQVAGLLDAMSRSGPWNIRVSIRFIDAPLDSVLTSNIPWSKQGVVSDLPNAMLDFVSPLASAREVHVPREDERDWATRVDHPLSIQSEPMLIETRPLVAIRITNEQRSMLMSRLQAERRTTFLQAPTITLFNGQTAMMSDESFSPFVVSVTPLHGTKATAMQPVINVMTEGVRITLRAVVSEDNHCELQCRISESSIDDVGVTNLPFVGSNDQRPVQIQTPHGSSNMAKIACRLARGQSLLIASPKPNSNTSNARQDSTARFYLIETEWDRPELR